MQDANRRRESPWTPSFCTIIDVDTSAFSYLACSHCGRSLPDARTCFSCIHKSAFCASPKRLYRLLLSVAVADEVIQAICFDRAARALLGCSADELSDFCKARPFSEKKVGEMLEGEMCQMTFSEPKNGNAQHLRAVSVVPLRSGFRPVYHALRFLPERSE